MNKQMKYRMYRVNKRYIEHMKKQMPWVVDPGITDLYVGPVLTVDSKWSFYVPVTSKPHGNDDFFVGEGGSIMGFVHVRKMIPCRREVLKCFKESTPESKYCMDEDNRRIIKAAAQLVYDISNKTEIDGISD